MTHTWISEEVEAYFASSPIAPLVEIAHVAHNSSHPVSSAVNECFARVPSEVVSATLADDHFLGLYGNLEREKQDWFARETAIISELQRRIQRRRRQLLLAPHTAGRPAPYDEPALADLSVSSDRLVPLSEFEVEEGVLIRNGRAYVILPPTPSVNASYWLTRALDKGGLRGRASVRLDPLVRGDTANFPRTSYRMLWWGPPLRWEDVIGIKGDPFGRWVPSSLSSGGAFTDFAWVRRGDEQHLFLEEVPKHVDIELAGSRYFHVIFDRSKASVVHLDAAIRIYSEAERIGRENTHVHRAGKIGTRIKVFRIDDPMEPGAVSSLGGTFFVWNYDVSGFFGALISESLLENVV